MLSSYISLLAECLCEQKEESGGERWMGRGGGKKWGERIWKTEREGYSNRGREAEERRGERWENNGGIEGKKREIKI